LVNHSPIIVESPLIDLEEPGFYGFSFESIEDSNLQSAYFDLTIHGDGSVNIGTSPGNSYLDGSLYLNNSPKNLQLTFNLIYNPMQLVFGLIKEGFSWVVYLLIGFFQYLLPGLAIVHLVYLSDPRMTMRNWAFLIPLSTGVGLAIYPVFFLITDLLGLHLGSFNAWLLPFVGLVLIIWRQRSKVNNPAKSSTKKNHEVSTSSSWFSWPGLTLIVIGVVIFGIRFWMARSLAAPMWGDSYQHAMITQLMLDNGGLFQSWQPYTPYQSLTTHFGFSAYAALFAWLTRMGSVPATLWTGQIINGLAVITLYPLALRIAKGNRWAAVGTVFVAGILVPMPAYYINWGRYAQLSGQAILPIALWLLWDAIDDNAISNDVKIRQPLWKQWRVIILAGISLSGLTLTYYRAPFYYAAFVLTLLLFWGLPKWRWDIRLWSRSISGLVLIGLIGVVIFIPWGMGLLGGNLAAAVTTGLTEGSPAERVLSEMQFWRQITTYVPIYLLVLTCLGMIWGLLQKRWIVAALPLWAGWLVLYIIGYLIRLPGANMLQSFAILIALYLPVSYIVGWMIGEIITRLEIIAGSWIAPAICVVMVITAITVGWNQRLLLDTKNYAMVTHPDQKAMQWIEGNTPQDANFLVQGFLVFGEWSVVGSDAGWWIPLLSGRSNNIPPQYALLNETPIAPDYSRRVVDLVMQLENSTLDSPRSLQAICDWGITHVYNGQRQGRVGSNAPQLFSPQDLINSTAFELSYHQDRVYIFALSEQVCK
jgi:hypothetical protein